MSYDDDDGPRGGSYVTIECVVKRETDDAYLIVDKRSGEQVWIPASQVKSVHRDPEGNGTIELSRWICGKKGLL